MGLLGKIEILEGAIVDTSSRIAELEKAINESAVFVARRVLSGDNEARQFMNKLGELDAAKEVSDGNITD